MPSNYIVAGSVGKFLREEFSGISRHIMEDGMDSVQRRIVLNTSAVQTSTRLGRPLAGAKTSASQFEASHPISFGRSGTIEYEKMGSLLASDNPVMVSKAVEYPSAATVPQRAYELLTVGLKWLKGSLTIDLRQLMALRQGNMVEDFLAKWMLDPYQLITTQITSDFFGMGYGAVATVASGLTVNNTTHTNVTIVGSVRRFWRGMKIAFFNNSSGVPGATQRGSTTFLVTAVPSSTTTPTITVYQSSGSGVALTTGDHICLAGAWDGTTAAGILGLNLFTDNTAAIHGLSKTDYPELRCYNDSPGTRRNLSPVVLQKAFDAIYDRGFKAADLVVGTRGLRSIYYQQEALFKTYNTDLSSPVQRGADGGNTGQMQYTTEEGPKEFVISPFCPANTLFLVCLSALIRYAPGGSDSVQFLGDNELLGGNMFLPSLANNNYTTVMEAPFNFWYENGCLEPQCLGKIGDLNELADVA